MKNHHPDGPLQPTRREVMHEAIATRAYDLWLRSARPDHQSEADWLEAERRLVASRQDATFSPVLPVEF